MVHYTAMGINMISQYSTHPYRGVSFNHIMIILYGDLAAQ